MKFVLQLKTTVIPVLALLVLALLIQNTCPHGFAGKTAVGPACHACPLRQHHLQKTGTQQSFSSAAPQAHYPLYVLSLPQVIHSFLPGPLAMDRSIVTERSTEAFPAELLRPPHA